MFNQLYKQKRKDEDFDMENFLVASIGHLEGGHLLAKKLARTTHIVETSKVFLVDKLVSCSETGHVSLQDLIKVRVHFKNIAFSSLNEYDYANFNNWIRYYNWLLILCKEIEFYHESLEA